MKYTTILSLTALIACADAPREDPLGLCDEAVQRLSACEVEFPASFVEDCRAADQSEVVALLEADCEQIAPGVTEPGKADVPGGGEVLCTFSYFCDDGFVCRPNRFFVNACQRPGVTGEHCWLDSHCDVGMECHNVWHSDSRIPHPTRVCNPHSDDDHPHRPIAVTDCPEERDTLDDPRAEPELLSPQEPVVLRPLASYPDRLRLQRLLKGAHPYPFQGSDAAWPDHRDGILLQTLWQKESGRSDRDAADWRYPWWPNINYMLTVWQMLALQSRGEFAHVTLEGVDDSELAMPSAIRESILAFYDELDRTRAWAEAHPRGDHATGSAQSVLQTRMWRFHSDVVRHGLDLNTSTLSALPAGERLFADSWGNTLVELLAIANFPTDGGTIARFEEYTLPYRLVRVEDYDGGSDLPATVLTALIGMRVLHAFERRTGKLVERTLRRVVDTADEAHLAAHIIETALLRGGHDLAHNVLEGLARLALGDYAADHCHEASR